MEYSKFYISSFVVFFCALVGNYATIDYNYNHDNYLTGYNTTPYGTADDPCSCFYDVTLDGLGRLTTATEIITKTDSSDVTHSHTYSYDMLSQLTEASITNIGGSTWTAGYDYNKDGNIQTRTINGDPCDYEYDGDLLIAAQGQNLDWDLNGNLTASISSSLTYNWDNKLQFAIRGSNSIALKYGPDDNRVWKKTTNSQNVTYRKYIIAEIDSLPVILLEIDPCDSVIKKSYVYAGDQIIMQHDGGMNADKYFYIHDRLGSVRQVIDVNASVKHLYSYGPFGKKLEADDDPCAPGNPFQFTGLYFDYEIDQHYARARQLSTELSRFTSRDPITGNFEEPLTLHTYLYCLNDPINRTDLGGEMSLGSSTAASGLWARLYGAGGAAMAMGNRLVQMINRVVAQHNITTNLMIRANYLKGKAAERAIQLAYRLKDSQSQVRGYLENGAYRVFDFVSGGMYIEVKNVAVLKMSAQLKDMLLIAEASGGTLNIIVRIGTKIPPGVQIWIEKNGIELVKILPDL